VFLYQLNIVCIFVSVDKNNYYLLHNEKLHYKYCFVNIKYSLSLLDLCDLPNYIALLLQSNGILQWREGGRRSRQKFIWSEETI